MDMNEIREELTREMTGVVFVDEIGGDLPEPQPGDVAIVDVYGERKRGVLDGGNHYGEENAMVVINASAFRGDYVSCSGGPCPCVPKASLFYLGTTEQRFWKWKDRPRAGGGEDYTMTVNLWEQR